MDNRERSRRDFSLGFTVPTVVLPNMIRVTDDNDAETLTQEDTDVPPAPRSSKERGDNVGAADKRPDPVVVQERPTEQAPAPTDADASTSVWVNATTTQSMDMIDTNGEILHKIPSSTTVRVLFPPYERAGRQWARVNAFVDEMGSIAVGNATIADAEGYKIGELRF